MDSMTPTEPPLQMPPGEYYAFMRDFIAGLPPPQEDSPEAWRARDNAAMAQVADAARGHGEHGSRGGCGAGG